MNILVAEDDPITLRRLQYFLEKWGHHVLSGQNGLEAIEIFLTHPVELVLTDWMMPEMDGLELVKQIANRGMDAAYVYVIILTAKSDKADVVQALSLEGVNDYITKPFDPDELRARISVGERTVRLERTLREYSRGLEKIVRHQTALIRKTQEETVLRLLSALETRDDGASGHIRRVGDISALIAESAGWSRDRIEDLRLAAPMHDIGKISLPDHLARKKGPLSAEEFELIKHHTVLGSRIFSGSDLPLLQMANDIAMCHHERWDGAGYPRQLSGQDIPEAARIVALADVFDTLIHDQPTGRVEMNRETVVHTMEKGRGTHFDPDLFDRFVERIDDVMDIAKG
ncbi:MAG: response regulator [Desulfobacterales bacterium]|nr:response regulator [Desulfobacterales bacterium]